MQNWRILSKNFFTDLIFFYFFHFQTFVDVMMYFHEKLQNALKIKDFDFHNILISVCNQLDIS